MSAIAFDWKAVVLAKHAQHVVLIHFPIALFLAGVLSDWMSVWWKRQAFGAAAFFNLTCAAVSAVPTIATGLLAWQWQLEGQKVKGVLLYHMVCALGSALILWLCWWPHFRANRRGENSLPSWRLPLEALGVLLITVTGHLGGTLSGVNL